MKFEPQNIEHARAPANAFAFEAECTFERASDRGPDGLRKMPVTVLARTGEPVSHWYFGRIVHDFDGLEHRSKIPFDWRHDADEPLGYADRFEVRDDGLFLSGQLLSRDSDDRAASIMDLGPSGVPYQQSIHFDADAELEYLPEGMTAEINGMEQTGPLVIVRKWKLLRCAFCLSGVDGGSDTYFEDNGVERSAVLFSLNFKDSPQMTKSKTELASQDDVKPGTEAGSESIEIDLSAERTKFEAEFKANLKRYTDRFGAEDGANYFEQSLSFESALEQHCTKLEKIAQDATKEAAEATEKLAQLDLGEVEAIATGSPAPSGDDAKTKFSKMFRPK